MNARPDVRLLIGESLDRRDHLHGAWWPRTAKVEIELPPMLSRAVARLRVVHGVTLKRDEWPGAPLGFRPLPVNSPKINWYGLAEAHSAVLHCDRFTLITLLVVPPETAENVALTAMMMTARPGNSVSCSETLAAARLRCEPQVGRTPDGA